MPGAQRMRYRGVEPAEPERRRPPEPQGTPGAALALGAMQTMGGDG